MVVLHYLNELDVVVAVDDDGDETVQCTDVEILESAVVNLCKFAGNEGH